MPTLTTVSAVVRLDLSMPVKNRGKKVLQRMAVGFLAGAVLSQAAAQGCSGSSWAPLDCVVVAAGGASLGLAVGLVETRPKWIQVIP